MEKRIFVGLLAAVLLLFGLSLSASAEEALPGFVRSEAYTPFSDVKAGLWYEDSVRTAVEFGILNGVGNGRYDPDGTVTVAQAVKIAACIHAVYQTGEAEFPVGEPWYRPYADYAKQQGLVTGEFPNYNAPATRLQIAEIFVAALPGEALPERNTVADNAIPDVLTGSEGAEQVYRLYRAGILQGSDSRHAYCPESTVRRSEVSALVERLILPERRLALYIPQPYTPPAPAVIGMEIEKYLMITVKWQRVEEADGYSLCISDREDGGYRYLSSVSDPEIAERTLSVDALGTYYFKIASYRTVEGRTLVGEYSQPYKMVVTVPGESAYAAARIQAKDYLETISQGWGWGTLQYSYYDMDGNGFPEMFIRTSSCPDNITAIYTYVGHAACLYLEDFSDMPEGTAHFIWSCRLLKSGVVAFDMVKQFYDRYDNPMREVIGMDFARLSGDKSSLVTVESVVYDGSADGKSCYQSSGVSSRSYLAGSRAGFRSVSESYFDSLYYSYGGYGSPVRISDWSWKDF